MIIGLFKNEITLKITLLMCNPTIISNILISCVEGLEKKTPTINDIDWY
jgi:hypothetical protein